MTQGIRHTAQFPDPIMLSESPWESKNEVLMSGLLDIFVGSRSLGSGVKCLDCLSAKTVLDTTVHSSARAQGHSNKHLQDSSSLLYCYNQRRGCWMSASASRRLIGPLSVEALLWPSICAWMTLCAPTVADPAESASPSAWGLCLQSRGLPPAWETQSCKEY